MAPYSFYHLNPLTGPLFAWIDRLVGRLSGEKHKPPPSRGCQHPAE